MLTANSITIILLAINYLRLKKKSYMPSQKRRKNVKTNMAK